MENITTFLIIASNGRKTFNTIRSLPSNSNIIILNTAWNSSIVKKLLEGKNRIFINIEKESDFSKMLTLIIKEQVKSKKIVIINPDSNIENFDYNKFLSEISERKIIIQNDIIGYWNEPDKIKNIVLNDNNSYRKFLSFFILDLKCKLNYDILGTYRSGIEKKELLEYENLISIDMNEKIKEIEYEISKSTEKYFPYVYVLAQPNNLQIIDEIKEDNKFITINAGPSTVIKKLISLADSLNYDDNFILIEPKSISIKECINKLKEINFRNADMFPLSIESRNGKIYIFKVNNFTKIMKSFLRENIPNVFWALDKRCRKNIKIDAIEIKKIDKKIETRPVNSGKTDGRHYQFIISFMNKGNRFHRFKFSIENLRRHIDQSNIHASICVHEIGREETLPKDFIEKNIDQYIFTEWDDVFHLAWNYNVAARYCKLPKKMKTLYIFFDGDMLIDQEWIDNLYKIKGPVIGWNKLHNITEECTQKIIKENEPIYNFNELDTYLSRTPNIDNACGGCFIIPKDVFFEVKGYPEDFKGTWGGDDNSFAKKLTMYGYDLTTPYQGTMWHLEHEQTTPKNQEIRSKWKIMREWTKEQWKEHVDKIGENWGVGRKIDVAMINYLREDKLIDTLEKMYQNTKMPLNICIQIQGCEELDDETKNNIIAKLKKFKSYNIIWSKGNLGTARPRFNTTQWTLNDNAKYTIIIDSDMTIEDGTFEVLYEKITKKPEYGVIACWCKPFYQKYKIEGSKLNQIKLDEGFHDTDVLGTGCVIINTNVFKTAQFNTNLVIGFIDFIWCMEVKKNGWKLGILADDEYKAFNDSSKNTDKYKKARQNQKEFARSREYIKKTYGIIV